MKRLSVIFDNKDDGNKTMLLLRETKTQKGRRYISMGNKLESILLDQREKQTELLTHEPQDDIHVVTNELMKPLEPKQLEFIYNSILKSQKISGATFHTLRHLFFATRAIENGMDIVSLSRILERAQPSTTMNKYGHSLQEQQRASMEKFDEVLDSMELKL